MSLTSLLDLGKGQPDLGYTKMQTLKEMLQERESDLILATLRHNQWNKLKSAVELGISYRSLMYKIKQYDLNKFAAKATRGPKGLEG